MSPGAFSANENNLNPYYYVLEDLCTYSRNEAIIRSKNNFNKLRFYFLDREFDKIDWTKEPAQDLKSLALQRCKIIREQYSWLCLWLSAGYDSQTVLNYFIEAGIKLDEIAFRSKNALFDDPEPEHVLETANHYRMHHNSRLKLNLINHNTDSADFYLKYQEDWIYQPGAVLRFSKTGMNNCAQFDKKNLQPGRADITGHEKLRVDLRDDIWRMFMPDTAMANVLGIRTVDFFLPDNQPDFLVKQIYHAVRFFEKLPGVNSELIHQIQSAKHTYKEWNIGLGRCPIKCLESSDGRLKKLFTNGLNAGDSARLISNLENKKHPALEIYKKGILKIQELADKNIDIFKTVILSKFIPICKFGNYLPGPSNAK
jgi:hypothetical protein